MLLATSLPSASDRPDGSDHVKGLANYVHGLRSGSSPRYLASPQAASRSVLNQSPLPEPSTSPVPRQEPVDFGDQGRMDLGLGAEGRSDGVEGYVEPCRLRCDGAHCPWPATTSRLAHSARARAQIEGEDRGQQQRATEHVCRGQRFGQ